MSVMVERVASAIVKVCEHRNWDPEAMARAAIEAMREPTKGMVSNTERHCDPYEDWRAMIDYALNEES